MAPGDGGVGIRVGVSVDAGEGDAEEDLGVVDGFWVETSAVSIPKVGAGVKVAVGMTMSVSLGVEVKSGADVDIVIASSDSGP